jgi:hypothetical protein
VVVVVVVVLYTHACCVSTNTGGCIFGCFVSIPVSAARQMQRDLSVAVGQANAARTKCATLQRTVDECRKFLLVCGIWWLVGKRWVFVLIFFFICTL